MREKESSFPREKIFSDYSYENFENIISEKNDLPKIPSESCWREMDKRNSFTKNISDFIHWHLNDLECLFNVIP